MKIGNRLPLVVALIAATGILSACPKHENFPSPLSLTVPPMPDTFVITDLGANASGGWDYGLEWNISDPSEVSVYRVYILNPPFAPELQFESTTTTPNPLNFPFRATGVQLGVSAVSTENVEGAMDVAIVP